MRLQADWLTQMMERILEFLDEHGNHPPKATAERMAEISPALSYNPTAVGYSMRQLAQTGLVVNVGGGTYAITDDGQAYLRGDLDASTLEEPDAR